ncbi:MAG: Rne/Rng family ribonuclease [Polyangiaceae bacterium]|jgi:ribonuclease G|nr:Rne/Rng family ribonuclease [Polyangiaceae bacterium]
MAQSVIVINVDIRETRVALIEGGIIAELHIERAGQERCLGDVVLGRVTRVLPGMQAAFLDVGLDKAAFLHVEDLIRHDDFEHYLAGTKRRSERDTEEGQPSPELVTPAPPPAAASAMATEVPPEFEASEGAAAGEADASGTSVAKPGRRRRRRKPSGEASADGASPAEGGGADASGGEAGGNPGGEGGLPPVTEKRRGSGKGGKKGGGSGGGEGKGGGPLKKSGGESVATKESKAGPLRVRKGSSSKSEGGPSRIDKSTPIRDVVREGQEVLVQISKEPIGTKGARVTSHVSLPGRYVVYMPTVEYVGISKRIGSEKERQRLRESIESMRPPSGGLIVRTVAEGLTKKQLKADIGYLVRLWGEIAKKREKARAPSLLYKELDLVLKAARDLFGDEVQKIIVDDREQYERLRRFVEAFLPERANDVELYEGSEPIFDAYGIEEEIARALARKVPLTSGGYLIIDEAEALTAIDVNTGSYVGKGSKDHEETILKTNLEAVEEIAYQLRFRNLGGLIVLDLIDMERASSREQVRRRLEELLLKDKAKTSLNRISELGLIEMTRKRTRESIGRLLHEPCFYCDGTGQVRSKATTVYEILRSIRRDRDSLPGYTVTVQAHPDIVALMKGEERAAVQDAERRFQRRIDLQPRKEYHLEQFDLVGR